MKSFRLYLALAMFCAIGGSAHAEISGDVVRVGVLNDISGIFQDTNGMGSVEEAKMAAEDFDVIARARPTRSQAHERSQTRVPNARTR